VRQWAGDVEGGAAAAVPSLRAAQGRVETWLGGGWGKAHPGARGTGRWALGLGRLGPDQRQAPAEAAAARPGYCRPARRRWSGGHRAATLHAAVVPWAEAAAPGGAGPARARGPCLRVQDPDGRAAGAAGQGGAQHEGPGAVQRHQVRLSGGGGVGSKAAGCSGGGGSVPCPCCASGLLRPGLLGRSCRQALRPGLGCCPFCPCRTCCPCCPTQHKPHHHAGTRRRRRTQRFRRRGASSTRPQTRSTRWAPGAGCCCARLQLPPRPPSWLRCRPARPRALPAAAAPAPLRPVHQGLRAHQRDH
jgi:hypothetical protein